MDYTHYTAHQLAQDERFQAWVLHPTPADQLFWERWLEDHPHRRAEVEQARTLLLGWHFKEPSVSAEEIAQLKLKVMQQVAGEPADHSWVPIRLWSYGRVAASVTVIFTILALLYWFTRPAQDWVTYQTGYGEIKTLSLPDGSEVTLNANSRLRFPQDWETSESRNVWLEGEAYFRVAKQVLHTSAAVSSDQASLRKFLVTANELEIAVVGTQFNVYARSAKTEVVLDEGIVLVNVDSTRHQTSSTLRMQPGEKVTYEQQQLSQETVNTHQYTAWRKRQLVFDAVPLQQVAQTIEETYGVKVVFANPNLAQQTFTGTVPSSNLNILLEALTGIYHLQIIRQDDQLIIQQK